MISYNNLHNFGYELLLGFSVVVIDITINQDNALKSFIELSRAQKKINLFFNFAKLNIFHIIQQRNQLKKMIE